MLKAYAVALVVATSSPAIKAEDGVKQDVKQKAEVSKTLQGLRRPRSIML